MKKSLRHYFSNCILLLLLFHFSNAQIKTTPIKYKANPNNEVLTLRSELISCEEAEEMADQIQIGKWIADTGTGFGFEFIVNNEASHITQVKLIFSDWVCGIVKRNGSVTVTSNWAITNRNFNLTVTIAGSDKYILSGEFNVNGNAASGTWGLESSKGNCSGTFTATPEGGAIELPDLLITTLDFNPEKGNDGTTVNFDVSIKNNGTGNAGTSKLEYYLSPTDTVTTSNELIGYSMVSILDIGETSIESFAWTIPEEFPAGIYYVHCIADADNQVDESNESNNKFLSNHQFEKLAQELPNLVAVAGGFQPDEASLGEILNVNVTVKNTGLAKADTNTVAFFLCEDPNVLLTDILMGTASISELNTDEESAVEIMYEITDNLPVGTYYIGYQLDYFNSVEEIENYNYYYLPESPFTRLADPQLTVSNRISDIILYVDSVDFTFDLEAPPAVFYYSNPDVALFYSINTSDITIAITSISGSIFKVSPLSEGTAIITVTANDGKGGTISTDFNVEVNIQKEESVLPFGGCLVLDGSDDYAEAFDHSELDLCDESSESITVEAWVNFSEFSTADIIVKPNAYRLYTEAYTSMGYQFRAIGFNLRSGITTSIVASGTTIYGGGLWNEGWHHVAGEYNKSSGKMSLYMDGERLHEKYYGDIEANNSDQALTVGTNFDGMIDEIRISDCARYDDKVYIVPNEPFSNDECTRALWHFDDPLESLECHDCCKEDNCLFLYKGAFVTSIESFDEKKLDHFELLQNYPNPFSVSTTIEFNVLKTSHLQIRIYDILGREVNTLVDGKYLPGSYQVIWNGKNKDGLESVSGIYLIKMQSGEFMRVKKVLLKRY